jgi:hypothetical protein
LAGDREAMADGNGTTCRVAPLVLSMMQAFSCIVETRLPIDQSHSRTTFECGPIIFSPILVVFLVRHSCALVRTMAIPIVAIFLGRAHYCLLLQKYEPNALPKMGDWAIWLNRFFGLFSVIIIAAWIFVGTIVFLLNACDRAMAHHRKARK